MVYSSAITGNVSFKACCAVMLGTYCSSNSRYLLILSLILLLSSVSPFLFIKSQLSQCVHQWLHPPKTGSTFCLSIQHACNETDFVAKANEHVKLVTYKGCAILWPYNLSTYKGSRWHRELVDLTEVQNYVTVLREPRARTLSGFCDYMHMDGMKRGEGQILKDKLQAKIAAKSPHLCQDMFDEYVAYPNTYGCYTKMLNGYGCYANITLTPTMVATAKHFLDSFSFVGVLEQYDRSVKLFFKMSGGAVLQPPLQIETTQIRKRASNYCNPMVHKKFCMNKDMKAIAARYHDPFDSEVYAHAKSRFEADAAKWGVP